MSGHGFNYEYGLQNITPFFNLKWLVLFLPEVSSLVNREDISKVVVGAKVGDVEGLGSRLLNAASRSHSYIGAAMRTMSGQYLTNQGEKYRYHQWSAALKLASTSSCSQDSKAKTTRECKGKGVTPPLPH